MRRHAARFGPVADIPIVTIEPRRFAARVPEDDHRVARAGKIDFDGPMNAVGGAPGFHVASASSVRLADQFGRQRLSAGVPRVDLMPELDLWLTLAPTEHDVTACHLTWEIH